MNMKRVLSIIGLLLLAGLVAGWMLSPRVTDFQPRGEELHGPQPIHIHFNRTMDASSVEDSLSLQPALSGEFTWNENKDRMTFTPRDAWPSDTDVEVSLSGSSRSSLRLPLLNPQTWQISISPYLLTYLYPADGPSNLFRLNVDSGENQPLTQRPGGILDYDISRDGLTIFFSASQEDGSSTLYALDRPSGETRSLLTCDQALCRDPQISPDGNWIAYQRIPRDPQKNPQVYLYQLGGDAPRPLLNQNHHLQHPSWSAEGWLAYYNQTENTYSFLHPQQSREVHIPNQTGAEGSWAPDGRRFVTSEILELDEELAPRHLFLYDISRGTKRDLTEDTFLEDANPAFSPGGNFIAFGRKSLLPGEWTPGRQLWLFEQDGDQVYPLTENEDYHHTAFAWHPDGSQLAFVRYNQAQLAEAPEIWLIDTANVQRLRLVINAYAPQWIP